MTKMGNIYPMYEAVRSNFKSHFYIENVQVVSSFSFIGQQKCEIPITDEEVTKAIKRAASPNKVPV